MNSLQRAKVLQKYLEDYLDREGLYEIIPTHRKLSIFTLPIQKITVLFLFLMEILILSIGLNYIALIESITVTNLSIVLVSMIIIIYMVYVKIKTKRLPGSESTSLIGLIGIASSIIIVSSINAVYLKSLTYMFISLVSMILIFLALALIISYSQRIYTSFGLMRLSLVNSLQFIRFILVVFPVMLVLFLLSVFSGEFWQAIGGIKPVNLIIGMTFVFTPVFILFITSISDISNKLVQEIISDVDIITSARNIHPIKQALLNGFIASEEWDFTEDQISWRDPKNTFDKIAFIRKTTRSTLILMIFTTTTVLFVVLVLYFYFLLSYLVDRSLVLDWTGIGEDIVAKYDFFGFEIGILSSSIALAKSSVFFAFFISMAVVVQFSTDDSFRQIFIHNLRVRVEQWISASILYSSMISPNYHIWSEVRNPQTKGVINAVILVPKGVQDDDVRKACEHMEGTLTEKCNLLHMIAFEKVEGRSDYRAGISGNKWVYIHNFINGTISFYSNHTDFEENISSNHQLGDMCLNENVDIPDKWFGEHSLSVQIGKAVWDDEERRLNILHPRISYSENNNNRNIIAHIHLRRRFEDPGEYRNLAKEVFRIIISQVNFDVLLMSFLFRDTMDLLYTLEYEFDSIKCKDWTSKKIEQFSIDKWLE